MSKPEIKVYSIEINNLSFNNMGVVEKGCVNIKISRDPEFIYHRVGNSFVARDGDFFHSYEYVPGSTEGFGGREKTLWVYGVGKVFKNLGRSKMTFKGSLWDSVNSVRASEKFFGVILHSVGINDYASHSKCPVYWSGYVSNELIEKLAPNLTLAKAPSPIVQGDIND